MQTIQIVLEEDLLKAADREVKRLRTNRSRLFRTALREHLKRSSAQKKEAADREGYLRIPEQDEVSAWAKVAPWPEE